MNKNPMRPINPKYIDYDCEVANYYCGRCGRGHFLADEAPRRSPCCMYPSNPLDCGPMWALPGFPDSPETRAFLLNR
jgi:hypothetical protein